MRSHAHEVPSDEFKGPGASRPRPTTPGTKGAEGSLQVEDLEHAVEHLLDDWKLTQDSSWELKGAGPTPSLQACRYNLHHACIALCPPCRDSRCASPVLAERPREDLPRMKTWQDIDANHGQHLSYGLLPLATSIFMRPFLKNKWPHQSRKKHPRSSRLCVVVTQG